MIYEEIFRELHKAKVRYLVVGGVAVVLHGFIRATMDLDLIVALDELNLSKFLPIMTNLGYRPRIPVQAIEFANPQNREHWKKEKGMLVFSFYHPKKPMDSIDVFVYEPIPFHKAFQRRKKLAMDRIPVNVIGLSDLIYLKKMAGRRQDLEDIHALLKLSKLEKL